MFTNSKLKLKVSLSTRGPTSRVTEVMTLTTDAPIKAAAIIFHFILHLSADRR